MSQFSDYGESYSRMAMQRSNGVLELRLHSEGKSFQWSLEAQRELVCAFTEIGADRENRIVIVTGTGEDFSGPRTNPDQNVYALSGVTPSPLALYHTHRNARRLYAALLGIEVPMIAAVNGPVKRHGEIALMCDIVIASHEASFEDTAHFSLGSHVPGDGFNVVLTALLGLNRARYLMLTGQVLDSRQALELGLVSEVMEKGGLMERARKIAIELNKKPELLLRYTRITLVQPLRRQLEESLGQSLAFEALATVDAHGR